MMKSQAPISQALTLSEVSVAAECSSGSGPPGAQVKTSAQRRTERVRRRECSRCGSVAIAGARLRGPFAGAIGEPFGLRLYRCLDCGRRSLGFRRR